VTTLATGGVEQFIVARVEMTVLGVCLYMFVEVLLWPTEPRKIVRSNTVRFLSRMADFASESSNVVAAVASIGSGGSGGSGGGGSGELVVVKETKRSNDTVDLVVGLVAVDVEDSSNTVVSTASSSLQLLCRARQSAENCFREASSFHYAASAEPDLLLPSEVAYPSFRWRLLLRCQQRMLCHARRMHLALMQLEAPSLCEEHEGNVESLVHVGQHVCSLVSDFFQKCDDVYQRNEELVVSEGSGVEMGENRRRRIVEVASTFRHWKTVLQQILDQRQRWYHQFIVENALYDANDQAEYDSCSVVVASSESESGIEVGKEEQPIFALEQHNQILLAAITQAATDLVVEMGKIGQCVEDVWLLK